MDRDWRGWINAQVYCGNVKKLYKDIYPVRISRFRVGMCKGSERKGTELLDIYLQQNK